MIYLGSMFNFLINVCEKLDGYYTFPWTFLDFFELLLGETMPTLNHSNMRKQSQQGWLKQHISTAKKDLPWF